MIEGITVLNQESIQCTPVWFWLVMLIIIILSFVLIACELFPFAFAFGILATILICSVTKPVPTGRYQYEVTIDDTVSMTKLYEKYEVVEQRGDIWVLEDKEE